MRDNIELTDCPEELQLSIKSCVERFPAVEILPVQKMESTPYKEKTIVDTDYKVFTLHGNYFCVYMLSESRRKD